MPKVNKLRVLVVEDHADSASCLDLLLTLSGFEVEVTRDGSEALEIALRFRPQVALIDLMLPGIDGFEVARRFRQHPDLRAVTLIALTGLGGEAFRQRSREAGFVHHLLKPADPVELVNLLMAATGQRLPQPSVE
jgi:two-component system CheB/CheR fusion protein